MLDCTFNSFPSPPRTVYRTTCRTEVRVDVCERDDAVAEKQPSVLERAILAVLHRFPEAYRAVIEEMRRIVPQPEPVT